MTELQTTKPGQVTIEWVHSACIFLTAVAVFVSCIPCHGIGHTGSLFAQLSRWCKTIEKSFRQQKSWTFFLSTATLVWKEIWAKQWFHFPWCPKLTRWVFCSPVFCFGESKCHLDKFVVLPGRGGAFGMGISYVSHRFFFTSCAGSFWIAEPYTGCGVHQKDICAGTKWFGATCAFVWSFHYELHS